MSSGPTFQSNLRADRIVGTEGVFERLYTNRISGPIGASGGYTGPTGPAGVTGPTGTVLPAAAWQQFNGPWDSVVPGPTGGSLFILPSTGTYQCTFNGSAAWGDIVDGIVGVEVYINGNLVVPLMSAPASGIPGSEAMPIFLVPTHAKVNFSSLTNYVYYREITAIPYSTSKDRGTALFVKSTESTG